MGMNPLQIANLFEKDITRDIKGVIKIGQEDQDNIYHELDEYIITKELNKLFSDFLESYKRGIGGHTDKMGVWISGFFGSGKSHFLKILSYLLEAKVVNGRSAVSFFEGKIGDPSMKADMERAGSVNADIMLFNIDSKSDSDARTTKEAIVKVFAKVFDEKQGYCGSIPWLGDMERLLVKEGHYDAFKAKFEELAGQPWVSAREDVYFEADNLIEALVATTRMTDETARSWYDKAESNYSISIEKFAKRVNEYIESKKNDHHVVFLVDEIGQYIGDDSNLMLQLQTIVEDLGSYCGGKAWVIVTSQEAIDSITKNMRSNSANFSKIMGRFNTRLSFTSTNVDEVIKRRLLEKTPQAASSLRMVYESKSAILNNLITFSANTPEMKRFKHQEEFAEVYPFIPYQFNLIQSVFVGIRTNGLTGMHLAQGERSLLSAFQESALEFKDKEIGALVPFNSFYNTIETFLETNIRLVINRAGTNEELQGFDVEVLKVLFLIKYVKEMPSNVENLITLMVSHIDEDKLTLKKQIEESLVRLLKQTLIQKNGEEYDFLTNEEQDINREIQSIPVEIGEIIQKTGEEIFEGILSDIKKYRYSAKYHFEYNKAIDDRFYAAQKHDIGLKFITPYYDSSEELNDHALKMLSVRENTLIVKLSSDTSYLDEMRHIIQINTYLLRHAGSESAGVIEEIKARKSREATDRKKRVVESLIEGIRGADLYANGLKLGIREKPPVDRINDGFKSMVENLYSKIAYIEKFIEGVKDLSQIINEDEGQFTIEGTPIPNKLALDEVDAYINRNTDRHIPTTLKTLTDAYCKAPYGWKEEDVSGLVLRLFKMQEITLELSNDYLRINDPDLLKYITKKEYSDRILVKKRTHISAELINLARELARNVFNQAALPSDEDGLMVRFKELSSKELAEIERLLENYRHNRYPGKKVLEEGKLLFADLLKQKEVKLFFDFLKSHKDDFEDFEEDAADVKTFFKGEQMGHFDKAAKMLGVFKDNESYVIDHEAKELVSQMRSIVDSASPYKEIPKLSLLVERFWNRFLELLETECAPIKDIIQADGNVVMEEVEKYHVTEELGEDFKSKYKALLDRLDTCNNFYQAVAMKEESDRLKLMCMESIEKQINVPEPPITGGGGGGSVPVNPPKPPIPVKATKNVSYKQFFTGAKIIETEQEVDNFLAEIKKKILAEMNENTRIKLS